MAKTQWVILFATFIISCASLSLLIVTTVTSDWVVGSAYDETSNAELTANYGLFTGSLSKRILGPASQYDLIMTCVFSENICALSCQSSAEARQQEVLNLLNGQPTTECIISTSSRSNEIKSPILKQSNVVGDKSRFISAGLWVTTILFLAMSLLFSVMASFFSVLNVITSPVITIFSVFGLYIWNGLTVAASAMTLILWGATFGSSISSNLAVRDTLIQDGFDSDGHSDLGYSFFLLLAPIILHAANVGLLWFRQKLINQEPPPVEIEIDKNEGIMLY